MYLILRPKSKLADSVACFQEAGLDALGCGVIDTFAIADAYAFLPSLLAFKPDLIVVTSTVAADLYINAIKQNHGIGAEQTQQPTHIFIAVGASTAKKLSNRDGQVLQATPSDSEGILACISQLKLSNAKVAILKGKGGRQLINDTLSKNGFVVKEFDLYERVHLEKPYYTERFEADAIQCIIATSSEIIDAAYTVFDPQWLNKCQWIVVSKRLKLHLSALGVKHIFTSNGATDSHLIAAANHVKGSQHE